MANVDPHTVPPDGGAEIAGAPVRSGIWEALRQRLGIIATIAVFLLALAALQSLLRDFHYHEVVEQLRSLSNSDLLIALLCTALSYWTLTGYDLSALHYVGIKLPYKLVAFASFTGYAVSNNLGFTLLSGGSVRYRLYSAAGVGAGNIAKIVVFAAVTFTVGLFGTASLAFLVAPNELGPLAHIEPPIAALIGSVSLAVIPALIITAAINRRPIAIWRFRIPVPSASMVAAQIAISGVDIALAAAVLYVVLPDLPSMGFWGFLGLFSVALLAGVISHIPGGLGVFESVILLGLKGQAEAGAVLGSIIAYRAIYFLLPLIVAGLLLAMNELLWRKPGRLAQLRTLGGATSRLVPPFMAVLVVVAGIILLISGASPEPEWRLDILSDIVPLPLLELSHILGSLIGLALLILARGLYRRLDSAWFVSCVLLAGAVVVSLIKGLDYEEAIVLALVLAILGPCRREFYRRARISDLRVTMGWLLAVAGIVGGIVWLTFFTTKHIEYSNQLWWQFAFFDHAPRSLRATFISVIVLLVFSLDHLFRPNSVKPQLPSEDDLETARQILGRFGRPEANVVLLGDKSLLFNETQTAFIMYGVRGRSWVALGDPVGPAPEAAELIWQFCESCDRVGGRPAFYQVGPDMLPYYLDVGLTPIKLGEEARVDLRDFSLDQPGRKDLRYTVRRSERDGLTFAVVPREQLNWRMLNEMKLVSDAWLATRNTSEKGFSIGAFDERYLREFDIGVVRVNGRITAFVNIWKAGHQASVDIMRFDPRASPYTMEYMLTSLLIWAKEQGFGWLGLGVAPLSGLAARDLSPVWQRLGSIVFQLGEHFYNFRGLRLFKDKFKPVWEPRYLVCQGGLTPVKVISDAAALIGGGLRGIWLK